MIDVDNVVIFMSDSVRWDSLPESVDERGVSVRTIAASPHTPTSLASMVTGHWLPQHSIRGFTDVLPTDVETILDRFPNGGLSAVGGSLDDSMLGEFFNDTIYNHLFERYDRVSLDDVSEPFAWFMRDPGGHAPYGEWDEGMNAHMTVPKFYDRYAGDTDTLIEKYQQGLDSSVDRFEKYVLKPLRRRGITENTLIVFLSDHGELLGEHGHVSQSYPICQELVYVPTVFIHPDLEKPDTDLMRHVDLPDTISHLTGNERFVSTPGNSIFDESYNHETGFCLYDRLFPSPVGEFSYRMDSMWDRDGGHVFVRSNAWDSTKLTLGYLTKISAGKHLRRKRSLEGFRLLYADHRKWGEPGFSRSTANDRLAAVTDGSLQSVSREMESDTEQRLEDLGYL